MADVCESKIDSYSCGEVLVIPSKKNDSLTSDIIKEALMDSEDEDTPREGETFRKRVKQCGKEGDIMDCQKKSENLNQHNVSNTVSCNDQGRTDNVDSCSLSKSSLVRAASDDGIALNRQQDIKKEIPSFQSEKGSQEMKQSQHQNQCLDQVDDSAELEISSSEEGETDLKDDSSSEGGGIYLAEDRFDFYREFEMKVDMLEFCDMAVEESFDILFHHVSDLMISLSKDESGQNTANDDNQKNTMAKIEAEAEDISGDVKADDNQKNTMAKIETEAEDISGDVKADDNQKNTMAKIETEAEDISGDVKADDNQKNTMAKIETEAEDISGDVKADIKTDKKLTQEDKQEDITENNSQSTSSVPQIQPGSGNDEYSIQDKVNLLSKIVPVVRDRFEDFISEVSDIVHLGALSVRHAQTVDDWGANVHREYQLMYSDHQKMQIFLEEKDVDWRVSQEQYQSEIVKQGQQITDLLQKLHLYNQEEPDTQSKDNNKYSNIEFANKMLMKRRCQEEQAMALDFSRQSKISELKLLVVQQQGYIQRLQLKNNQMEGTIRDILGENPDDPTEGECGEDEPPMLSVPVVSDVLYCDQAVYIPHRSTDSDTVGRQVFNIGDAKPYSGPIHPILDPRKLSYICLDPLSADGVIKVIENNKVSSLHGIDEISSEKKQDDKVKENKQGEDEVDENKQDDKVVENKQDEKVNGNKQDEKVVENKQDNKVDENKQNEKVDENKKDEEKVHESKQDDKIVENKQDEKVDENKQDEEKIVENKQDVEKVVENKQDEKVDVSKPGEDKVDENKQDGKVDENKQDEKVGENNNEKVDETK